MIPELVKEVNLAAISGASNKNPGNGRACYRNETMKPLAIVGNKQCSPNRTWPPLDASHNLCIEPPAI